MLKTIYIVIYGSTSNFFVFGMAFYYVIVV